MEMERQLVYNSVTCLECNETIVSHSVHDYKTCSCPNEAMVDGGTYYTRYGAKDMSKILKHTVYADDDFEIVRQYATRGGRGIDGTEPLSWTKLCDMNDGWLQAVVDYGGEDWHIELIKKEIEWRNSTEN